MGDMETQKATIHRVTKYLDSTEKINWADQNLTHEKNRKLLIVTTPIKRPVSKISSHKICFCIQPYWLCLAHKASVSYGKCSLHICQSLIAKRQQKTHLGTSTPKTVRVSSFKGKSGSRVCGRSFHLSAWRFIHPNITFKRNLWWIKIVNSIYIVCSTCWLCKWMLSLRLLDSCLSPPQLPGSQLPVPYSQAPNSMFLFLDTLSLITSQ